MSDGGYVRVRGLVEEVRPKSILFAVGSAVKRASWLPRSCIHGADDLKLDAMMAGEEATLQIREWKADECGFTATHDPAGADRDMFGGEDQ